MAVECREVSKSFGDKLVLDRVSLRVNTGEQLCLMGPSGYGKTTLLHILLGLLEPDSGSVAYDAGSRFAPVFQEDRLCEGLSVGANIRMTARAKLAESALTELLAQIGLVDAVHTPVRALSGGMKRRVSIARALLSGGDIFVFDEPFKGLDDATKVRVMDCVRARSQGKTLIYVSHDAREAELMGCRVVRFPLAREGG